MSETDGISYEAKLATYMTQPASREEAPRYRFALLACARWEEEHIAEWLNYHRSIGFEHVYLYGNDDDPATLYERILPYLTGDNPFVTYVHYPYQGQQLTIYRHAIQRYSTECEWLMLLDIDEFLCLPGVDDVGKFMEAFTDTADAVYFNWKGFGTSGHATRPKGSVLVNYTGSEGIVSPFTKTLVRTSVIPYAELQRRQHIAMHHEWAEAAPHLRLLNVISDPMNDYYLEWPNRAWVYLRDELTNRRIRERAYIAHYAMKSDEDFDRRVARGLKGDFGASSKWGHMTSQERNEYHENTNAVEDLYLRNYWLTYLARAWEHSAFPAPKWPLLTENVKATQSSIIAAHAKDHSCEDDAAAALSEAPIGYPRNHTEREVNPWWRVDLGMLADVHEIRIFNRLDTAMDRIAKLRIDWSYDDTAWNVLFEKGDETLFGGLDGFPFRLVLDKPISTRFLKITVIGDTYLHFDRVEIFGHRQVDGTTREEEKEASLAQGSAVAQQE